ncbi:MAG: phage portal protein, partial [Planctomycetota bacterium]
FAEPMRKPKGYDKDRVVHGVELDALGAAKRYCLTELKDGRREFVKWIGAESIRQHGFFDRYGQVRGVSPLAPALNPFRDMMEAQVYALALMKLEQLLGVKIMRSADDPLDGVTPAESGDGEVSGGDSGGASGADEGYAFDFTKGPAVFDLEPGDDVQMLTGVSPHTNFQAFLEAMTMAALKALDLDFCLYDSSHTNYSGSRQAGTTYDLTSRVRREELASLREWITERQLAVWVPQWVESGALQMPEGMTVEGITFEWRSVRPGWIDRLKELKTEKGAVDGLMTSKKRASMRLFGEDYDEVFEEIVQERQREKEAGLEPVVSAAVDVELDRDDEQDDDMPQRRGGAGENEEGGDA